MSRAARGRIALDVSDPACVVSSRSEREMAVLRGCSDENRNFEVVIFRCIRSRASEINNSIHGERAELDFDIRVNGLPKDYSVTPPRSSRASRRLEQLRILKGSDRSKREREGAGCRKGENSKNRARDFHTHQTSSFRPVYSGLSGLKKSCGAPLNGFFP